MATELGAAYISVGLGTNTLTGDIKKAFGGAESAGKSAGGGAGRGFLSGFKGLVGAGLALAGAGVFGGFIAEAARASDATDKFKATMDFAGLDTKAIDAAKTAAKSYADQTVYDLPTIQNMLAQLASNGVKDYTGLTKAAGNLNAVAGGNADTFKSVAMVMTQTAGAGKLTTENWNQLADAIPGAAGPLMKSLKDAGAYTGNFRDAMADGQISSDEFNASLMKLGTDPVAVEAARSTKTFEGAIGNLEATINSGLMSALDALKPAITGAISGLAGGLSAVFGAFGAIYSLFKTGDFNGGIRKALGLEEDSPVVATILAIRGGIVAMFAAYKAGDGDVTSSGFAGFMERVGNAAREVTGGVVAMFAAYKAGDGDVTSSGFAGSMERIGNAAREVTGGVVAMFAAFKAGDGDITSSGFAGFMEQVGGGARQLFDGLVQTIGPLIPQIVALASAFSPMQIIFAAIQPLLPQLGAMFTQLGSVLGGTLLSVLSALTPMFVQLSGVVSDSLGVVLAAVLPTLVQMITMLGATLSTLIPIIIPIIMTIAQLATILISQLMPIITSLVASILPPLVDIFGNILSAIGPVITMVAGLLIPIIMALMPVVVTVFGVIAEVIKNAMQIVQGVIQVVTGIISGNWSQVWSGILNIFSGIWKTIVAVVGGAIRIVGSVIGAGLNLVFRVVGSVLGSIGSFFARTWNNVISGVSGFIGGLLGFFSGLPGRIMGALSGLPSLLVGVGQNMIQGLIDGVGGMISNAVAAVRNVGGAMLDGIKGFLGIHSPSRVFKAEVGMMIGAGLIAGIDSTRAGVASSVNSLVSVPSVPSLGAGSYSPGLGVSSGSISPAFSVYVGNEQLDARTYRVAEGAISTADRQSTYVRPGRR